MRISEPIEGPGIYSDSVETPEKYFAIIGIVITKFRGRRPQDTVRILRDRLRRFEPRESGSRLQQKDPLPVAWIPSQETRRPEYKLKAQKQDTISLDM